METIKPYYQKHIFVCVNVRDVSEDSCGTKNSAEIHRRLKEYVKQNNLAGKIRVSKTLCQDMCVHGPIVAIHPDNVVYKQVSIVDIEKIIEKHITVKI